jgi:hypothetical protein
MSEFAIIINGKPTDIGLWADILDDDELRALGGPGSGNFEHAGRPGQVGGSAPDDEDAQWDRDGLPADDAVRSSETLSKQMVRRQEEAREIGERFRSEEADESTARSIQFYQGGSYASYNANVDTPGYSHANDIVEIQTAILENGYDGPEVLTYRGMTADPERVLQTFKPGETVEISGFQSTSFDIEQAAKFLYSSGGVVGKVDLNSGTLLEILAVRGLHIGGEDEFLLPHGSRFKVVGVRDVAIKVGDQTVTRTVVQLRQKDRDDYPTGRVDEEEDDEDGDYPSWMSDDDEDDDDPRRGDDDDN